MPEKINKNLTGGNIKNQLITLTWPMLFGMMGMVIFNLVDTYFIGKLGVRQLAAIFSIIRMLVLYVPLAWAGSKIFGIDGVFWAGFTANLAVGTLAFAFLFRTIRRIREAGT